VFKQQPITAVEREQQSGHPAQKQPPIVQDWACAISLLLCDPPAAQHDQLIVHNTSMVKKGTITCTIATAG